MAYEDRSATTGSHVMTCDVPGCEHDCLSPSVDDLHEDMSLAGWTTLGKDEHGHEQFQCPTCGQGTHPMAAMLHMATGGTGEVPMEARMDVSKGEAFYTPNGDVVSHYTTDAVQGDTVMVQLPEPQQPPSAVDLYDDMMEGSDDDDDQHGRVSAIHAGAVSVDTCDGDEGPLERFRTQGDPRVKGFYDCKFPSDTGPSTKDPPRLQRAASGPPLNTDALRETASLFDRLDPRDNDWDPDA